MDVDVAMLRTLWNRARGLPRWKMIWILLLVAVASVVAAVSLVDAVLDKPLRAWGEKTLNDNLNGYTVRLESWDTHLWRLAMTLHGLTIIQDAHPETPVADIASLDFKVSWRALVHLRLLGDLTIDHPSLRIDLSQLKEEGKSGVKFTDRGWQPAIEAIYPLKLEALKIHDGSLIYVAVDPVAKPLRLTNLEFSAQDLRNVQSKKGVFPSPVKLDARLFETGTVAFVGQADFMAKPRAGIKGRIEIERVPLDRLGSLAKIVQLRMTGGILSANGTMESSVDSESVHLREVLLEGWKADYVTSDATKAAEKKHVEAVAKAARKVDNSPRMLLRIDRFRITESELGFVNTTSSPDYRLYLSKFHLAMDNLTNQSSLGSGTFDAGGEFMGTGLTKIKGSFRPDGKGADFDLRMEMADVQLASLNDMLQAYAGFDVDRGRFSLFSEIAVKDNQITGYIKPLVSDLHVYGNDKDHDKGFLERGWEHVVDGFAKLLENDTKGDVATVVRLHGKVSDPQTNNFRVALGLIRNGFLEAVLPGLLNPENSPIPPKKVAPSK